MATGHADRCTAIREGQVSLMMTEAAHGPTVLRILLGTHLRRLRESRGVSAQQAAKVIRGSESKISRIELGRNAIREIDILDLLTYYGVERDERDQLLTLAEQANRPGWWHRHTDILPEWFQTYVGMEESAASIRLYEPQFVPGLLQTEQYAAAVLALGDFSPEDAERHVLIRKERQRRFARGDLKLWVIIEEPALRRSVAAGGLARCERGGAGMMGCGSGIGSTSNAAESSGCGAGSDICSRRVLDLRRSGGRPRIGNVVTGGRRNK